jgi:hypothetical protein
LALFCTSTAPDDGISEELESISMTGEVIIILCPALNLLPDLCPGKTKFRAVGLTGDMQGHVILNAWDFNGMFA